jgi:hypothetical protein
MTYDYLPVSVNANINCNFADPHVCGYSYGKCWNFITMSDSADHGMIKNCCKICSTLLVSEMLSKMNISGKLILVY